VTLEEIQQSLRRVSGIDVTITKLHTATRYTDTTRQAGTYRRGRVLLAGDAAHVHSPAGGQGLNLGIGDAVCLGPKLAAVAGGTDAAVLDAYTAERHPAGARVQAWTMAQTALGRRDPRTPALREVVTDLINTRAGATCVFTTIAGLRPHRP
jgi:2-polyprenyl-6-methoxyphenol hydroxylase-like FAD-dependent oxidoreductase